MIHMENMKETGYQMIKTTWHHQNMHDEVNLMNQIQENSPTPPGSFKKANTSHAEFRRNSTRFFQSVQSIQGSPRKAVLSYNTFKSHHQLLRFLLKSNQSLKT